MRNYQLDEVTTRATLRRQLADHFRRVQTDNPKVIDILLFKGQAEAHEVMAHYTQRHHLVRARRRQRGTALRARLLVLQACVGCADLQRADTRSARADHALRGARRGGAGGARGGDRGQEEVRFPGEVRMPRCNTAFCSHWRREAVR